MEYLECSHSICSYEHHGGGGPVLRCGIIFDVDFISCIE